MSASLPPLQPHATRDLAAFASGLTFADIPAAVVGRAKLCLLDGIGVCLQGATLPWTRIVQDMVATEGARGAASVFARGLRTSCWPIPRPGTPMRWTTSTPNRCCTRTR